MQRKTKIIVGLTTASIIAMTGYLMWPTETPSGETRMDPSAQASKLFDKLTLAPTWFGGEVGSNVINGIKVPPMPDKYQNSRDIAGIDSDHNGVRDDIDRILAERFGGRPEVYAEVLASEKLFQIAVLNPTDENVTKFTKSIACMDDKVFHDFVPDHIFVNTKERGNAYMKAFAGATIFTCESLKHLVPPVPFTPITR